MSEASLGNGFCITNSVFGYSRSRGFLLKASHGEVKDNLVVRTAAAGIAVSTEYGWLSGGCASDLEISGNTLWQAGTRQIEVAGSMGYGRKVKAELQSGAHHDIRITGNRLVGTRGVYLEGCGDCAVTGNVFEVEGKKPEHRLWYRNSERITFDAK